ncbi:hypothetical protein KXQ82_03660 [Mucilaginibacter sp. HMF5004]|uniref:hypothetical protein n=1 Tax=Mucilaginibacter rivuli TaxID=2857527 RepID=UPI001C5D9603|nr:hypothetical protein [Mucilaginibacter rivuli]MBW4888790.1 hypothetical protein [Mucilaginibacter rivuli]
MKRKLLSLADYKSNIGDLHSQIATIINLSVADWSRMQDFSNSLGIGSVKYKPRTKAGIVHDHISHRIFNEFFEHADIKAGEYNGVFGFLYKDLFFIRFKKMDPKNFKMSGAETFQSIKYRYQDSSIPGLPERPTILYAGYSLDKTGSEIRGIYTACWDGEQLMWIDEYGGESIEQVTFAFDDYDDDKKQQAIEQVIKRVKVKKNVKRKNTGTNN